MRKSTLPLVAIGTLLACGLYSAPASAQQSRSWVSGVGDDFNPCTRTAPCKTFSGAISKTAINGIINCLDPGAFGVLTINKSITVDCHDVFAGVLASGQSGMTINIAVNANDPHRTVHLRNIYLSGTGVSGTVGTRTGLIGVRILSAAKVILEDMLISDFSQQGVADTRVGNGSLFIRNTTITKNNGACIGLAATGGTLGAYADDVRCDGNGLGVAAGTGNNFIANRSVFSGNTGAGVQADGGQITINGSLISNNGTGVIRNSGTVRLSNNDIAFNNTGITGATTSFGNNRISGNGSAGTAPTAAGAQSHDLGQQ
jgi:hypothetical protein